MPNGEFDFYMEGRLRWGIEVLVNEDSSDMTRIAKFGPDGIYAPLQVDEYIVLDLRRGPAPVLDNRVTVFLDTETFSSCSCVFASNLEVTPLALDR